MKKYLFFLCIPFLLFSCKGGSDSNSENTVTTKTAVSIIDYAPVNSYPHDVTSFTEGFLFQNGQLYESTGAYSELPQTKSLFGPVDLATGKINKKVELDRDKYFGEGIAFLNGKVYQLTYKTKVGFVYDTISFKKIKEFTFPSKEGWGLTTDGKYLVMSDGTNVLTYLDPESLQVVKTLSVTENDYARENLNELEYIKGFIYANVYTTNTIVKIDPSNGKVVGKLDLTSLALEAQNSYSGSLEMNGIAYDSISNRILVTGKLWPKIYEIKFNF
jgi:glutamine cyclotransferase